MIEAQSLFKRFGAVEALRGVSFNAPDGRITGILGPNGAGKSTALRILSTVMRPDQGDAFVDGTSIRERATVRARIGVLPHDSGIYPNLTARENIEYYGRLHGMSRAELEPRVDGLIEQLDIGPFASRRTKGFSQGQRTKVALARTLVHRPKNVLLDEPTNGLDVMATRSVRELIRKLKSDGMCVLFSSHVMQEVAALCDEIIILAKGEVVAAGAPDDILTQTGKTNLEDAFVAAIVGATGSAEGLM